VHETVRHRDEGPRQRAAWKDACVRFHAAKDAFYAPITQAMRRLREGDTSALEIAVAFLEVDPYCFRSGYVKAQLIREIKRVPLPPSAAARLREVVLSVVDRWDRREFRSYCGLARKVDAPPLRQALSEKLENEDPGVRRRARWVLEALERPT
jgi:hypothetical protein